MRRGSRGVMVVLLVAGLSLPACVGAFKRLQDDVRRAREESTGRRGGEKESTFPVGKGSGTRRSRRGGGSSRSLERSPVKVKKELANGLAVVVEENFAAPVVAVQVWVNVGSADEPVEKAGLAHFFEHMVFKGTKKRGVGVAAAEIEALGGDLNAFTSYDHTVYHVTIASRYFETALDILSDLTLHPLLDAEELNREREVILEEIRLGLDSPQSRLYKYLFSQAYQVHPYQRPVIGFEETVRKITREDLLGYHRKWYRASYMTVIVTGDVEAEGVMSAVKKYFGEVPAEREERRYGPRPIAEPAQNMPRVKVYREDVSEGYMYMAFHIPDFLHSDAAALDVLSVILGGGESSRLVYRVRTEKRLVDKVWAYAQTPRDPGLFWLGSEIEEKKAGEAMAAILKQVYLLKHEEVDDWELRKAKLILETDGIYARETVDGQARQSGFFFSLSGDPDYEKTYLKNLRAVTKEDLKRVAARYFRGENLTVAAIFPLLKKNDKRSGKELALNDGSLFRIIENTEKWNARFVAGSFSEEGPIPAPEVPEEEETPALNGGVKGAAEPVKFTLKNGIRLIVRENHSVPLVSLRAAFEGGLRRESPDQNGISNFIAEAITEGTAHYSAAELHSMIEARGGSIAGFAGRNSVGVLLEVPSPYFRSSLPLLVDVVRYPTFPEEEMDRIRGVIVSNLRSQMDHPRLLTMRLFRAELFKKHPYGMDLLGTETTVQNISQDALLDYYQSFAVPGNLVLSVVGDVKTEEVKKLMEEKLGDWVARPYSPDPVPLEPPPKSPRLAIDCREEANQTNIVIGFQGSRISSPDRFPLEVLSAALSGMSGRLFKNLRDQQSLAYSVFAFNENGLDPGFFGVYIGTAAEKEEVSREMLIKELKFVREQPLSDEEFRRAQQVLIGDFEISLQRFRNQALYYAMDELFGLGYQASFEYADRINAVTSRQVLEAAKKYLQTDAAVTAVVRPCGAELSGAPPGGDKRNFSRR